MHTDIFSEPAILFVTATISLVLFRLIKAPAVVGYLAAGMLIGPYGLGLLENYDQIHTIAEVGVILLLFTIGLEVSPSRLWALKREALIGGHLQVILTACISGGIAYAMGMELRLAVVIGFFFSLSSTAVVLKLFTEKGTMDSPHGRNALAILLFQDIIVIPMTIIIPLLNGGGGGALEVIMILGKSLGLMAGAMLLAKLAIPWVLDRVAVLRSREGFLLTLTTIILGTVWMTSWAGLSPALGAFLAGLVISETEYKHVTLAEAVPFRDMFLAVFFVSVGMLLNLKAIAQNPLIPIGIALGIYALKGVIVFIILKVLKYSNTTGMKSGAALGQVGEFSFVILFVADKAGVISGDLIQTLLAAAAVTILLTPVIIGGIDYLYRKERGKDVEECPAGELAEGEHVAIVGFGLSGRMVAQVLKRLSIPYHVAEMNPVTVKNERKKGEPIYLGDASKPEILKELEIGRARAAIIAISDVDAVRPVVVRIKQMAPRCHIIVRTKYTTQYDEFKRMGADDIVQEDMEASLAIAGRLLGFLGQPVEEIKRYLERLRLGELIKN